MKRWPRCGSHRYDMQVLPPFDPLDHPAVWRAPIPAVDVTVFASPISAPRRVWECQSRQRRAWTYEQMWSRRHLEWEQQQEVVSLTIRIQNRQSQASS